MSYSTRIRAGSLTTRPGTRPGGIVLLTLLFAASTAAQPVTTGLPRLPLDQFPSAAREPVTRAYREAEARPGDVGAAGALARMLHSWEQWNAAHEAYGRAQALAPRAFEWHYLDAIVLQRLARHGEAADRLSLAVQLSPEYVPARVKLAEALFEAGAHDESRRVYEALAREPISLPTAQFGLGRLAALERRHEAAVEHLRRAVAFFPRWGAAYYALARSYRTLGRLDEARHALEQHAQFGPQWPALDDPVLATVAAARDDARAVVSRGVTLAATGDLPGAIELHEAALSRDPSLVSAHLNLISLYGRTQQWAKAEAHYQAALTIGTDVGDAHYDYGVLLGLQGHWVRAIDAYRRAIASNPHHARARNNLGEALERQGDPGAALDEYRQAVTSEPGFRLARFNVARMLLVAGKPAEAIVELEKLVEPRDGEAARYLFGLAAAHARAGRKDAALTWAREAHRVALAHGQSELAVVIARDLANLK